MLDNTEIRSRARAIMEGQWNTCALILLIFYLLYAGAGSIPGIGVGISILVGGPLSLSLAMIFLRISRNEAIKVEMIFEGFNDFGRNVMAALLISVYTFLWTLLLIVPGIIAAISYSMTYFIMADDPQINASDAIKASKEMMMGHKTDFFVLMLSFIGWIILGIISFGIGFLWIGSYMQMATTVFYHEIRGESSGIVREADKRFINVE